MQKCDVNGPNSTVAYEFLRANSELAIGDQEISWNFAKFLVNGEGHVVKHYVPHCSPLDIVPDIEDLLNK